jgi:AraC-like DNA-binding protein
MIYKIYKPCIELKPYIHFYWIMEFDSKTSDCSNYQRIIPNGFIEIMFNYSDKLNILKNNKIDNQPKTAISGQKTDFFDIIQTGQTGFVAILFKPHSTRLFFDLPMQELTNQSIDIENLIKHEAENIIEQIGLTDCHNKKISIIEKFLIRRFNDKYLYNFKRITKSINFIDNYKGIVKVSDLANSACLSEKQFYRIFLEFVGVSPKQFLKIVRLQSAFYQIQTNITKNLTELAYNCGYFDQAHFINDFKILTGLTPKKCFEGNEIYSDYFSKI